QQLTDGSVVFGGGSIHFGSEGIVQRYFDRWGWFWGPSTIYDDDDQVPIELSDHSMLLTGGHAYGLGGPAIPFTQRLITSEPNVFTATLAIPKGYVTPTFQVVVTGTTSTDPLAAVSIDVNNIQYPWQSAQAGVPVTLTATICDGP